MRAITARADIDRLFTEGTKVAHPLLLVLAIRTPEARDQNGRVLFVAGKRLGNAVWRNRAKRVLREATRRAGGPWPGWDVALVARARTGQVPAPEIDVALSGALSRLVL
jgi:ribonuclease P protein component